MPIVADCSSILAYLDADPFRWNSTAPLGTGAVITYAFKAQSALPPFADLPEGAEASPFTAAQKKAFRAALDEFEANCDIRYVEVDGPAMIDAYGVSNSDLGGYAYYPFVTGARTGRSDLAIDWSNHSGIGSAWAMETLLHEIGHAVGLSHPHDGAARLTSRLDSGDNTVMSYNFTTADGHLERLDREALERIYGADQDSRDWKITATDAGIRIAGTKGSDCIIGADRNCVLQGKDGKDRLIGREHDDRLDGGAGSDKLWGGAGRDRLDGRDGNDKIRGEDGADRLYGGAGKDKLWGGAGDDRLKGDSGNDRMWGGDGSDIFVFSGKDRGDHDVIRDFAIDIDILRFTGPVDLADADLRASGSHSTLLVFDDLDLTLTLVGIDRGDFADAYGL